jgi:hypothetical protein
MKMTDDVTAIAAQVSTVDEAIMKVLPFVTTMLGFVPGAAVAVPFLPLVSGFLAALDNAAKAVAAGNPGAAATDILQEVISHLTPGAANSPALAPEAAAA